MAVEGKGFFGNTSTHTLPPPTDVTGNPTLASSHVEEEEEEEGAGKYSHLAEIGQRKGNPSFPILPGGLIFIIATDGKRELAAQWVFFTRLIC